jgi:thiol-disulfide isomerase/thioredoxin
VNRPPNAHRSHDSRGAISLWAIAIAAILVLGGIAVVAALTTDEPKAEASEFGQVSVAGDQLPKYSSAGADPAVGQLAPVVEGNGFDSEPAAITSGKPTLVVFLAHWCPHCNNEAPRLKAYLDANGVPDDVDLVIVPTGSNETAPNWPPSEWVKSMGLDELETLVDDEAESAAAAFGLDGYPYLVALDADRKVVERRSGEQPEGAFAELVELLRAG